MTTRKKPPVFTDYQKSSVTRGHNFWVGELQMLKQIAEDPEWDTSKSAVLREMIRNEHHRLGLRFPNDDDPT